MTVTQIYFLTRCCMDNNLFSKAYDLYDAQQYQEAFDIWSRMDDSPEAMYNAGLILIKRLIVVSNHWNSAYNFFKKAIDLGDKHADYYANANYYLGLILKDKFGEKYYNDAVYRFHDAIMGGNKDAINSVIKLAELGNIEALSLLTWCYCYGHGTEKDRNEAEKWGLIAYDAGERYESLHCLGWIYREKGENEKAFRYLKESACSGNDADYGPLGDMYRQGLGTSVNYTEAIKWYSKGAEAGHEDARYYLGLMHLRGMGCKKNKEEALKCFSKVVDSGNADFIQAIALHYHSKSDGIYDPKYAIKLWEYAAAKGNKVACVNLGIVLYSGENIPQDYNRAYKLFKQAESEPVALEYLGLCHYWGHGCPKDEKLAKQYFVSSLNGGNEYARRYLTSDKDLRPYSKWDMKEKGAEIHGGAAAFLMGSIFSAIGGDD